MITTYETVNFGSRKASLSTIGYRRINPDGTTVQARTTTGVSEIIAATGLFGANITVEDDFNGAIIWDTGEATPLYAMSQFDYREVISGGVMVSQGVWRKAEKEKLLEAIKSLLKLLKKIDKKDNKKIEAAIVKVEQNMSEGVNNLQDNIKNLGIKTNLSINEIKEKDYGVKDIKELKESIETLAGALGALLENEAVKNTLKEATND